MQSPILLTSFATWLPHQASNAADDLLVALLQVYPALDELMCVRQLPVDFQLAPVQVVQAIARYQPSAVICCGMAESRSRLSLEAQAFHPQDPERNPALATTVKLADLISGLTTTEISYDAGRFVCNALYYATLQYLAAQRLTSPCMFVHVPILTPENQAALLADFFQIVQRIKQLAGIPL